MDTIIHEPLSKTRKADAPSLLEQILEETEVGYIQLLHDSPGDFKFRSAYFAQSYRKSDTAMSEYLHRYVEEEIRDNIFYSISAKEITERIAEFSGIDDIPARFDFLPVCSQVSRLGVLILGHDRASSQKEFSEDKMLALVELLSREKRMLVEFKDKIYELSRTLITVQEPKNLGEIFKHQINPLLNLASSAIVYSKGGKSAEEYNFYYNYGDLQEDESGVGSDYHSDSVGAESHVYFYEKLRRSNDSEFFFELDFERYADTEELHPFFNSLQSDGFRKAIIVNLLRGSETVGFWIMIFDKGNEISDLPEGMLDTVAIQIAAAVHCINTFSQLISIKKEGEILQSLNIDLAATRDDRHLLKLIRTKLLNLFQFSHHYIYKINDDQMTVSMMLADSQPGSQYHPSFDAAMAMQVHIADGIFNKVLISSEPVVFDLFKLNARGQLPLYLRVNYESGIRKMAMLALRVDSKIIGIWCLAFTEDQPIILGNFELIKKAAAPISIAVANLRINDSLRERESERDKLMDLSFDLTTVRSKNEFSETIKPYLRKLFCFDSLSIFVDKDDYETRPFIYFSSAETGSNNGSFDSESGPQFEGARNHAVMHETTDVTVVDLDRLLEKAGPSLFLKSVYDTGSRAAILIALRNDNRQVGVLSLYLPDRAHLSDHQLHLFKEISYQIAKAVANILYNEEIAHREEEKELLLALSEDIAGVREKDQLVKVIDFRLKPVLKFAHISLSVKCSDEFIVSFLTDPGSKSRGHRDYHQLQRQDIRKCADFINFVDASPFPVIISENHNHGFSELPKFLSVNFESGIEEILIARLFDGVTVFGYWVLFFKSRGTLRASQFGLLQGIANQFSTAIYNITASQEIAQRQNENELLITLSNDTAGLRNYFQLMKLVSTKLRSVFDFQSYFIGVPDDDGRSYKVMLPQGAMGEFHYSYSVYPELMPSDVKRILADSDEQVVIDREDKYDIFWKTIRPESELNNAVVSKFLHDDELLGVWVMFFPPDREIDQRLFRMLKGITDQLSIAIANISVNEKLASNEMQKGLLLSLSTKVSSERDPVGLLKVLAAELKTVLNFSHGSIVLFNNKEKTFALPWVLPSESKSSGHARYKDITRLTPVYDGVADSALKASQPLIIDIADFPDRQNMPLYMQVSFESGMSHVIFVKLVINGDVLGFWVLWYDKVPGRTQAFLELIEQIANVLAVPIFNISSNEQINKREQEKSYLLDFIGAIADVKNKFELRRIFSHYLRNLCLIEDICLHWFAEDRNSQYCYFWNDDSEHNSESDFQRLISSEYPVDDIIFANLAERGLAEKFSIRELIEHPQAPSYLKLFVTPELSDVIGVPLFKGKDIVGVLFVKEYDANTADQPLFKGLCKQLTIAVSDLITNEKVSMQLTEINSYKERLEEEKIYLKQELETSHHYSEIVGESEAINRVFQGVSQVASSDSTVLILGETGTGKELIARAIHNNSPRKNKLMVKVNCAALPANLIESELFGHERGSFTGATDKRIGKFELASGGTLFLDEIGELPLELQVKFLRALQEQEIERIGGRTTIKIDVRIVAATNRDLQLEIAEGRFRSDLYFRLSTFPIVLPALRERKEDIPVLAAHFVRRFAKKTGKSIDTINQKAMNELTAYGWPGNVRELEHQIERSVLVAAGNTIKSFALPAGKAAALGAVASDEIESAQTIDEHERALILKTLRQCHGKISGLGGAAALLGVPSSTLNSKMKRLGIRKNFLR